MENRVTEIISFYKMVIDEHIELQNILAGYRFLEKDDESGAHDKIPDLLLALSLLRLDLAICNKHLLIYKVTDNIVERNYFIRALAMHFADIFDDNNTKGKRLLTRIQEIVRSHYNSDTVKYFALSIQNNLKKLKEIKKVNSPFVKEIRNNIFTHRDKTGLEQYDDTSNINDRDIALLGADIEDLLTVIMSDMLQIQQSIYIPIMKPL